MGITLDTLLSRLANLLPPMLAEDDVLQGTPRNDIAAALRDGVPLEQVNAALAVVERLFCTLALLHVGNLAQGIWRFNSYAAWLVARSILESMATNGQTVVDPGYWSEHPTDVELEEQRVLLKRLEQGRVEHHPFNAAKPIRFVYVAWAVIRIEDRFLLFAREDRVRSDARGHFGFPGGRFKLSDAPYPARPADAERHFAYGVGNWPMKHLNRTLYRELREELDLSERDHYSLGSAVDLDPYCKIEGARNHHTLTEYRLRLYPLALTNLGVVKLFERLEQKPHLFAWFTAEELSIERNVSGQRAFVTALVDHFGPGLKGLLAMPKSVAENYLQSTPHIGFDIPLTPSQPITSGRSGKGLQKFNVGLSFLEHRWLWILAWHNKSLPITGTDRVVFLPLGWVALDDLSVVISLQEKLVAKGLSLIEIDGSRYARLSVNPRMVYFDTDFFRYRLQGNSLKGQLELFSIDLDSELGSLRHELVSIDLGATLIAELRHLDGIELLPDNAQGTDNLRRMFDEAVGEVSKNMGIRQLISYVDKARQHRRLLVSKG